MALGVAPIYTIVFPLRYNRLSSLAMPLGRAVLFMNSYCQPSSYQSCWVDINPSQMISCDVLNRPHINKLCY